MASGLHTSGTHAGLRVGKFHQQASAIFQKGAAIMCEGDAPCGAHLELDIQPHLLRIEPAANGGQAPRLRHALQVRLPRMPIEAKVSTCLSGSMA